jgi:hypothetical protein
MFFFKAKARNNLAKIEDLVLKICCVSSLSLGFFLLMADNDWV